MSSLEGDMSICSCNDYLWLGTGNVSSNFHYSCYDLRLMFSSLRATAFIIYIGRVFAAYLGTNLDYGKS